MSKDNIDGVSNEILKLIVDHLDCIAITDEEGRYIYVNQSWSKIMGGIKLEEVKGKYVRDVVPDTKIHEALDSKKPIVGHAIKTKDVGKKDAFSSYIPILKEGKVVAGFIHVIIIGMDNAIDFTHKVNSMTNKIRYYEEELRKIRGAKYSIDNIIGSSKAIKQVKHDIYKASRFGSTVLIEGETGSGKELVAHSIHNLSSRNINPFIKVNCAAIPNELLESEFFGYDEGAFTGAKRGGKVGKFEMANRGSIFLDEINQMPYILQPKLLRVLQEKEIERVGGKGSIPIDVRVIAATNCSLEKMIKENNFRSDLYYRLNVIPIRIPPIRERKEDIPLIADDLLNKLNFQLGMNVPEISDDIKSKLQEYNWPGNVRELQNVIERAMNMSWGEELKWKDFERYFSSKNEGREIYRGNMEICSVKTMKNSMEKEAVIKALKECNNNRTQAAKLLGISRTLLYRKIEKYNLNDKV